MNIGLFTNSMENEKEIQLFLEGLEYGLNKNIVDDASIFYNDAGFSPYSFPCGLFNSTDLWGFSGKLLVFSIDCLRTAMSIVNNIEIYYCYGWEDKLNTLNLIDVSSKDIKILCNTETHGINLFRLTGKDPVGCIERNNLINILEKS